MTEDEIKEYPIRLGKKTFTVRSNDGAEYISKIQNLLSEVYEDIEKKQPDQPLSSLSIQMIFQLALYLIPDRKAALAQSDPLNH